MAGAGLAIAGAVLPVVQSGGNMLFQARQNKLNRQFAEGQALLQRQYANEDFERQNAYNAPAAQKQRMKDAGLNPNMMYGGSGGSTPSATVRSSAPADYKGIAPQSDINFQSLMQIPLMMEQNRQLQLINDAKELDNRLRKEAVGATPPSNNEFMEWGDGMQPMYNSQRTYLKNNPYAQSGELKAEEIIAKKFQNEMNAATTDEQRTLITTRAAIAQINEAFAVETNATRKEMLSTALDNAKSEAKIKAAQAQLMDMEIGMQSQYYIGTLIKILSLMK